MKYLISILTILLLSTSVVLADNADSAKARNRTDIINAGWLHDWQGQATQWMDIDGMKAEVHGYVSVDRRIRFFKDNTFEIDVYKQPNYVLPEISQNGFPCPSTHSDIEVSVITGSWSVKKDSVYLIYKRENIYNLNEYSEYQSVLGSSEPNQKRPKVLRNCKFHKTETYVWSNRKMCLAGAIDLCFK